MAYSATLKLDGITGDSDMPNHHGEIDILSFSWGVSNAYAVRGTDTTKNKVPFGEFSVMKSFDSSSSALNQKFQEATAIATAVITLHRQVRNISAPYLVYKFQQVYVTSMQIGPSGRAADSTVETVTFRFETGTVDYAPQTTPGAPGGSMNGGWDVSKLSAG
jgi:type VI secretion system secreted protein Hcp